MTNYQKGRSFEYRVANFFKEKGFYVVRTAGSHSLFDLILFGANGFILPLQLSYRYEKEKEQELINFAQKRKIKVAYIVKGKFFRLLPDGIDYEYQKFKDKNMFEIVQMLSNGVKEEKHEKGKFIKIVKEEKGKWMTKN